METTRFHIIKRAISTLSATLMFGCVGLFLAPWIIEVPSFKKNLTSLLSNCRLPTGSAGIWTNKGTPTECFKDAVNNHRGSTLTGYAVNRYWGMAREKFGEQQVDPIWRDLAKLSVKDIEQNEWPLFFYANIPVLNHLYAPHSARICAEQLRAGNRCEQPQVATATNS